MLCRYGSQVAAAEIRHLQERAAAAEEDEAEEDEDVEDEEAEELLQLRMDAGLYSLQQCSIIIGHLWATSDSGLRKRILALLHQKGQTLADIRFVGYLCVHLGHGFFSRGVQHVDTSAGH